MENYSNKAEIDRVYKELSVRADEVYKFVIRYSEYINTPRDYGTGEMIGMVEVHILTMIADNPGITVTEASKLWGRTLGAVSQTVSKLVKRELITREKEKGNAKTIHLYATERGQQLATAHKIFDNLDITETLHDLLQKCSLEEIDTFYKVLHVYNELLV
ncbi:MAG: MarR family transcriptional regulator [Lachnospiraceae bacterium]|nr:MarR family transcriptional regulator [Lachnospiraceae bacterium]